MPRRRRAEGRAATPLHLIDTNVILRFLIGDDPFPRHSFASTAPLCFVHRGLCRLPARRTFARAWHSHLHL